MISRTSYNPENPDPDKLKEQDIIPPKRALRFLRWFCREDYIEEIEGDLTELFENQHEENPKKANRKFTWNVIKYFRPEFIKSFTSNYSSNHSAMFRHNFIISFRNFKRYKMSFFINLIGLSTGLACALLIIFWVLDELSVDTFHKNDSQLYQVMVNYADKQGIHTLEGTPGILARTFVDELPEVEGSASVVPNPDRKLEGIISCGNNYTKAEYRFVSKDFFKMFTYKLIQGDKDRVLINKSSIAISKDIALNLFNTAENAVGKFVEWEGDRCNGQFQITGVFQTPPSNSTIQFDVLFTYDLFLEISPEFQTLTGPTGPVTYILLQKNTDVSRFNGSIFNFMKSKYENSKLSLFVRPYSDRYLYNEYKNGMRIGGRIVYVRLFSVIAIFILSIACINFMNLSTANASRRLKEIGIKKAIGASRTEIALQYLGESILITMLSVLLSVLVVALFLPQFNTITGKQLTPNVNLFLIISVLSITVLTGLLAGSYPAFYLSGFRPVSIFKGGGIINKTKNSVGAHLVRRGLVVFQFTISIILIVSVSVLYQQMSFIHLKNLGFDRDHVITFSAEGKVKESIGAFLWGMNNIPGIISTSYMNGNFTGQHGTVYNADWEGKNPDQKVEIGYLGVGYDLFETLGMEIKEGRSFSREFGSESSNAIFNESAIKSMGLIIPVGQTIKILGQKKQIIGVVKDFHFESLYTSVKPIYFTFEPTANNILVKIKRRTEKETLALLEGVYKKYNNGLFLDFRFLDQDYEAQYASEKRVAELSKYFAGIAILISCLGLFGLAAFTAERRTKEIGIRKILGAGVFGIVRMLSGDFTKMVLTAIIIALPISYIIAKNWLDDFAYRIDLEWWFFIGAGFMALLIAWFTVGIQTIKAARVNPVDCLRDE